MILAIVNADRPWLAGVARTTLQGHKVYFLDIHSMEDTERYAGLWFHDILWARRPCTNPFESRRIRRHMDAQVRPEHGVTESNEGDTE